MSARIVTADTLERGGLRDLFNAGFSGYLVPMHLDEAAFATHLDRGDIELAASPVLVDGDPLAFALVGIRGSDAWIGGMGTVPAARRGGRARAVLQAAVELARARGCRAVWLEVIDANRPALSLYEQLGFETVRDLLVWRLPVGPGAGPAEAAPVELGRARSWITAHRAAPEPWQRADPVLAKLAREGEELRAIGVERDGALGGAAVFSLTDGSARVLQIAARDESTASALLRAAADAGPLSLANVPENESASQAMIGLGGELIVRQHEMRVAL